MAIKEYSSSEAFLEHLLLGNRISILEATLLFGVQSPTREIHNIKKKGFFIKSEKVSMAKIIRRLNETTVCKPPENLPYKTISMTEYWISK